MISRRKLTPSKHATLLADENNKYSFQYQKKMQANNPEPANISDCYSAIFLILNCD